MLVLMPAINREKIFKFDLNAGIYLAKFILIVNQLLFYIK